jgi:hypothetical protein
MDIATWAIDAIQNKIKSIPFPLLADTGGPGVMAVP